MSDPVTDQLDAIGAEYEIVPCDPDLADTAKFCEAYGYAPSDSANAILVVGKSDPPVHVMCLVLADSRLDVNKVVRKRLGVRKCSFASPDQTIDLTGMEIGGVTPFGTSSDLELWIDSRVMERDQVIIGGGSRDRKLLVPPATLAAHPGATVAERMYRAGSGEIGYHRGRATQSVYGLASRSAQVPTHAVRGSSAPFPGPRPAGKLGGRQRKPLA